MGKTWLLKEFGRTNYENVAYVNCQRDRSVASIFKGDLDFGRILRGLAIAANTLISPSTTLVVVDEIQEAPDALTALKYFTEERPEVHIAAAGSLLGLDASVLLQGTGIFEEFKGALTEQYVLQQIVAARNTVPVYWAPDDGGADLDFSIERSGALVPIEVKAEENLKSQSLRSFVERFHPSDAWRFSLANYRVQDDMINVPLYAIGPWLGIEESRDS